MSNEAPGIGSQPSGSARTAPWAVAGALLYAVGLGPAPPEVRVPLNLLAAGAVTLAAARWYARKFAGCHQRMAACAIFAALVPTWLFAHALAAAWLLPLYGLLPKWFWIVTATGYCGSGWLLWRAAQTPPERLKQFTAGIVVNFLVAALTFGALEIGLRVVDSGQSETLKRPEVTGSGAGLFVTIGKWLWLWTGRTRVVTVRRHEFFTQYPSDPRGYFEPGNRITYRSNSTGFRDADFEEKRIPKTLRIAMLGDSYTLGMGVRAEDLAAVRLEPMLSQKLGCPTEIYNFGVGGFNTYQEAELLNSTVWRYQPDLVMIQYTMGDVQSMTDERRGGVIMSSPWFAPLIGAHSWLAAKLESRLQGISYARYNAFLASNYDPQGQTWKEWRETLQGMARSAQVHRTPLLLLVHPDIGGIGKYDQSRETRQVMEAAREFGLKTHDLLPAFKGYSSEQLAAHAIDPHPNEIAQRLLADYAVDKIADALPGCPQ